VDSILPMVLLVVYDIWMREARNSLVMYLVSFPIYVNLAHLFFSCLGMGFFFFLWCVLTEGSYPLLCKICRMILCSWVLLESGRSYVFIL
jgi:hypothetical protein